MSARRCNFAILAMALFVVAGCRETPKGSPATQALPADAAPPPWHAESKAPTPPRGMVWIPEGALVAGTPEGRLPRLADQEMPGEQIVLHGFFMDQFAFPNEEGAIPRTGLTQAQAEALCAEQNKRLCTELEWERACKGPDNFTYEYGDRYRPDVCLTGRSPRTLPSGYRQGCRSEFGARDMHGSVWEWTRSRWGRGGDPSLVALRGGNGEMGEVIGRCANAIPRAAKAGAPTVGFRCCMGAVNEAVVSLNLERGRPLETRERFDRSLAQRLESLLPAEVETALAGFGTWRNNAHWDWRPIRNARFVVGGGCAGTPPTGRCGVLLAELVSGRAEFAAWVWSGIWPPVVRVSTVDTRKLWIYGGDRRSPMRQAVLFEWGRLRLGEIQRKFGTRGDWKTQ
jgi:formylglycine-generating enzyme